MIIALAIQQTPVPVSAVAVTITRLLRQDRRYPLGNLINPREPWIGK